LDGGGIRGAFPAAFLARLQEHLKHPIASYFDLIAGTSTGGIIAIGLGLGVSAPRPPAGDLVLLANARLICEPNFYLADVDRLFARDFIQARWEIFKILDCSLGLRMMAWPG
jgi:predicted acylesterase/phospholipase RssA